MCLNPLRIVNPSSDLDLSFPSSIDDVDYHAKVIKGFSNRLKKELNILALDAIRYEKYGYKKSDSWRYSSHLYVPCRRCVECLKQSANQWRFRLAEESKNYDSSANHLFVTLTFSDEVYDDTNMRFVSECIKSLHDKLYNRFGVRFKHWYVTERGKKGRLHLHGLLYDFPSVYLPLDSKYEYRKVRVKVDGSYVYKKYKHFLDYSKVRYSLVPGYFCLDRFELKGFFEEYYWPYGYTFFGYVNEKTFNYVTKYITKYEDYNFEYRPKIFASPGIGRSSHRIILDKLSTLSLVSGDFLISCGSYVTVLPQYYRRILRKYISNPVYYRCMDRTLQAFGSCYRFDGKNYDSFEDMCKAKDARYAEDCRRFPDLLKSYKRNSNLTLTFKNFTEYGIATSI